MREDNALLFFKTIADQIKACLPHGKIVSTRSEFPHKMEYGFGHIQLSLETSWDHGKAGAYHVVRLVLGEAQAEFALRRELLELSESTLRVELLDASELDDFRTKGAALVREARALYGDKAAPLAGVLGEVAALYRRNILYDESADYYRQAAEAGDHSGNLDAASTVKTLQGWASVLDESGRYRDAVPVWRKLYQLLLTERGESDLQTVNALRNLASSLSAVGEDREGNRLRERAVNILERIGDSDTRELELLLRTLASDAWWQGSDQATEALLRRTARLEQQRLQADKRADRDFYMRLAEEPRSLIALSHFYDEKGRADEAKQILYEGLRFMEGLVGPKSEAMIPILMQLAEHHASNEQPDEAITHLRTVRRIGDDASYFDTLAAEVTAELRAGRYEATVKTASSVLDEARQLPDLEERETTEMTVLLQLAVAYRRLGRQAEAIPPAQRLAALFEKYAQKDFYKALFSTKHQDMAQLRVELAHGSLSVGRIQHAWSELHRAATIMHEVNLKRILRRTSDQPHKLVEEDQVTNEVLSLLYQFQQAEPSLQGRATEVALELSQSLYASGAARSLAQMALRAEAGAGPLSSLVRSEQDLRLMREALASRLAQARAKQDDPSLDTGLVAKMSGRLKGIDDELRHLEQQIAREKPSYVNLLRPHIAATAEIAMLLKSDEVLLHIQPGPSLTDIWLVAHGNIRWHRINLGTQALTERVAILRCGLDEALWKESASRDRCLAILQTHPYDGIGFVGALPFDLERAHELYEALLAPFEDLIKDKHLLVVPLGPLTSLPFGVLVTKPPTSAIPEHPAEYRDVAWLGTRQAITVLPSVSSLKALREQARASRASKTYLGIGNPLLDGRSKEEHGKRAATARAWQQCLDVPAEPQIAWAQASRSVPNLRLMAPGTHANIKHVRTQSPLPETAYEVCQIARSLGMPESEIILGNRTTETVLKDLSEKDRLNAYRIVHFATHGALAGEMKGISEPGLIMTPPPAERADDPKTLDHDDGYLSASEIATLKLDADWVILSACNTAGPAGENAEALSGLARAFFYAGARTLLVSHWAVGSQTAVRLTTRAFEEMKANELKAKPIGRAESFRLSMRELIRNGSSPIDPHPMKWSPFVVVGEGGK
ncbi:CHAT domain-containing tetratricopeptide repeat protein [Hyphomicrobium sp. CS1BSMeth3]|uniref:CHAT domain-containing protein n=1 Tax=Hyphomicrobium sp. CS1BSMeth3 TaxID=1892844 RepID=UPI00092FE02D|nr:CHAT domain-containing tetratricopeptide repeat protein [Hyphomicrobium sp. CS1BSMeth3]